MTPPAGVITGVRAGLQAFLDGIQISQHSQLRPYVWLPVLVSLAVTSGGLYIAFDTLNTLATALAEQLPNWLSFLEFLLEPLLYLFGVVLGAWLFAFLAVLIASPFLGALSLAVEKRKFGSAPSV